MPTLPNMSLVTPTLNGDNGTWDDKINAAFALLDAHDHTSGKGARITPAAMNINANLGFGGFAITAAGQVAFTAVAALAAGSKTIFVSSADNELYWRTNGGTNVKLTSGNSINTTLVGGIVGDYTSVGAAFAYDDANKQYTAKTQAAKWARLRVGPVRISEFDTTESVYVEHAVATALAASYTVTWPTALPGAQALVQIDASGNVVFSNTLATDVTLSGTTDIKHGDRTIWHAPAADYTSGTYSAAFTANVLSYVQSANGTVAIPLQGLKKGDRVKNVNMYGTAGVGNSPTIDLYDQVGGAVAPITETSGGDLNALGKVTMALTTPITILSDGEMIVIKATAQAGGTFTLYEIEIVFDRP